MARGPKHDTIKREYDAARRGEPYEGEHATAVGSVRYAFLTGVAIANRDADTYGVSDSQVAQAAKDLEAAGFVLERDAIGQARVTNLDHEPTAAPAKTRRTPAKAAASSTNGKTPGKRPPALGDELRVTGLYLEVGGVALELSEVAGPRTWRAVIR